ncbi:hypothetical protein ABTN71_20175, partial [Acinetobacter baumannii]
AERFKDAFDRIRHRRGAGGFLEHSPDQPHSQPQLRRPGQPFTTRDRSALDLVPFEIVGHELGKFGALGLELE